MSAEHVADLLLTAALTLASALPLAAWSGHVPRLPITDSPIVLEIPARVRQWARVASAVVVALAAAAAFLAGARPIAWAAIALLVGAALWGLSRWARRRPITLSQAGVGGPHSHPTIRFAAVRRVALAWPTGDLVIRSDDAELRVARGVNGSATLARLLLEHVPSRAMTPAVRRALEERRRAIE